ETLDLVTAQLSSTLEHAGTLPEALLHEQVDEEWSAVKTVRHMVMVIDGWLGRTICGDDDPFHPIGLPPSFMPAKLPGTSIDPDADPTFAEAFDVWNGRVRRLRDYVDGLTPEELDRPIVHDHAKTVREGLWVIFGELWAHNQYMTRDLALL